MTVKKGAIGGAVVGILAFVGIALGVSLSSSSPSPYYQQGYTWGTNHALDYQDNYEHAYPGYTRVGPHQTGTAGLYCQQDNPVEQTQEDLVAWVNGCMQGVLHGDGTESGPGNPFYPAPSPAPATAGPPPAPTPAPTPSAVLYQDGFQAAQQEISAGETPYPAQISGWCASVVSERVPESTDSASGPAYNGCMAAVQQAGI